MTQITVHAKEVLQEQRDSFCGPLSNMVNIHDRRTVVENSTLSSQPRSTSTSHVGPLAHSGPGSMNLVVMNLNNCIYIRNVH